MEQYVSEIGISDISPRTGIAFLQDRFDIRLESRYSKLSSIDKRRKRAILILNNCLEHKTLAVPKSYSLCKFSIYFKKEFQRFIDVRIESGLSLSTINRDVFCLNKFSSYLDSLYIRLLDELESVHIVGFMKNLSVTCKLPTLDGVASSMRLVLHFLFCNFYMSTDLSSYVPQVQCKPDGIPLVYTKDEVQQLLNGIDRTGPTGKRNYALILLAARLGIRASDICGLKLDNLKWQTNTIEFIVKKTGVSTVLPLLNEVGEAIIDYIKNGRPLSKDNHVFLRMQIPFVEMKPSGCI